jgi:hypothetical protein
MENLYFMNEEHALGQNSGGVNLELKNNIHLMGMLEDGIMAGTHATQVSFKEVFILGYWSLGNQLNILYLRKR